MKFLLSLQTNGSKGSNMTTSRRIIKNLYRDSVSLMQLSEKIRAQKGIL